MGKALHLGKIYRFMGMDGIIPSLESSTLLYRNPMRFNDPLDLSSLTWNVTSDLNGTLRHRGLEIIFSIFEKEIRKREKK